MVQPPALYYALWPSWFPRTLYAGSLVSENTLLLGSWVNKAGPEHVLYVVQAGPNSYTRRSYGLTLIY